MQKSQSETSFRQSARNELATGLNWDKLGLNATKGMRKWTGYSESKRGHFPHPTNPDINGLPWHTTDRTNECLPSEFIKPCINTAPTQYNWLRKGDDVLDFQQAEMCESVRKELKHSKNFDRLLDPTGNSHQRRYHIYGSTKPLGRMYFDHKNDFPQYKLKDSFAKKILPEGYERQHYEFWR